MVDTEGSAICNAIKTWLDPENSDRAGL